ncbi:hypothetical protein ACIBCT_00645 [Streptosporangium sp. NPDC050855]|uniref:hypothetical protein n=1 Tax=Streptosporangium sp. NPDC050855 TaxID=3366194 RepID=UPI0037982514
MGERLRDPGTSWYDLLEDHLAARRRERLLASDRERRGPRTLVESLPDWIKSAKHREEILKVIARLRATLDGT